MVSLICTSYNKFDDFENFLSSLRNQNISKNNFEVVFIDQSGDDFADIINSFPDLNIVHLNHYKCGLSQARNVGILNSKGEIYGFPDDDCKYYTQTLQCVLDFFNEKPGRTTVVGRIYDINNKKNILKKWPNEVIKISKYNFYALSSSITIFTKNKDFFNEELGAGGLYGSCEDVDYIYKKISVENIVYTPSINVWHRDSTLMEMTTSKALNYGLGFGRFHRTNISFFLFIHFLLGNIYTSLRLLIALSKLNMNSARIIYYSLKGRILGLVSKKN